MKFYLSLVVAMISSGVFGCDVCGSVSGPNTNGLLTGTQTHFFGIRANYSSFTSLHRNVFTSDELISKEQFGTASVLGRWQFTERVNVQMNVPYAINGQSISGEQSNQHGLGDISLQTNWLFLKKKHSETQHILTIGAGIKMPTGRYSDEVWETSNLYPGTGSWDPMFSMNYRLEHNNKIMLLENSYALKTRNKVGYRFGDALISRVTYLHRFSLNNSFLSPSIGAGYQYSATDKIDGLIVDESFNAGHSLSAEVGLNYLIKNWMLNTKWSYPIVQYLSNGDVTSQGTLELGIFFLIQKR